MNVFQTVLQLFAYRFYLYSKFLDVNVKFAVWICLSVHFFAGMESSVHELMHE